MFRRTALSLLARSGLLSGSAAAHVHPARVLALRSRGYSAAASLPRTCPECSADLPTNLPVCSKCRYIAKVPKEVPLHELFGLQYEPDPFKIDEYDLKRRWLLAQRVCHPDTWSGVGEGKLEVAQTLSSYVNEAYKILRWPYRRARYILNRNGVKLQEEDKLDDPELIMEIMEVREELEDAPSQERREEIRAANQVKIRELVKEMHQLVTAKDWDALKNATIRLKYLEGIDEAGKEQFPHPGANQQHY